MKKSILICLICIAFGCIDEMPIELPQPDPVLVVDALISSEAGESQIVLGWTSPVGYSCQDSFGNIIKCEPKTQTGPYKVMGQLTLSEENSSRAYTTSFRMNDKEGIIQIKPAFTGTPGERYRLDIEIVYNGAVTTSYHAETIMLRTPDIDNITYTVRKGDVGKSDNFVPLISFAEPEGKSYYLFQLCKVSRGNPVSYCGSNRVWSYSLIEDTSLPSYVEGLSVDDGASIAKYAEFYPAPEPGGGAEVRMYSVTEVTYNFYKSLIDQFNNDGGAYSPTPATPRGNIDGEALGLFRAVDKASATVFY